LVINGEIGEKERAYPILEQRCNVCIKVLEEIDLASIILMKRDKDIELRVQRDLEIINESGPKTRKIFDEIISSAKSAIVVNSPGVFVLTILIPPVAVVTMFLACFRWAKERLLLSEKRAWGTLYPAT
jgi:hypothetical protein